MTVPKYHGQVRCECGHRFSTHDPADRSCDVCHCPVFEVPRRASEGPSTGLCSRCHRDTLVRPYCDSCEPRKTVKGSAGGVGDGPLIMIVAPGTKPGENPIDALVRMHDEEVAAGKWKRN